MVDDNFAKGIRVIEVRPTVDGITFSGASGEYVALAGPITLRLHPGENEVYLGTMNLQQGMVSGGKISISDIEVEIENNMEAINPGASSDVYDQMFNAINSMEG